MLRSSTTVRKDGPALLAALVCAVALVLPGRGGADVPLYQTVVPVQGTSEADRTAAFGEALRAVAVRATGRREAAANSAVAAAAADPSNYVQQYGTTADRMLKVGFDGRAMEQLLMRAGLPLWPAERPATLVVLEGEGLPERTEIERAAQLRGVPINWPAAGIDVARTRAQAISGDARAAAEAGGGGQAVLVGSASGSGLQWVFAHAGTAAQVRGALEDGVHLAADTLAARYAPPSTRSFSTLVVRIGGLGDVKAYAGLLEYLKSLSFVRTVAVEELAGDTVRLALTLRGDLELLRRIAALDTHLLPVASPDDGAAARSDFTYQP